MIHEKDGRARSHRTVAEERKILEEAMADLSPEEKYALEELLAGMSKPASLFDRVGDIEYKHRPVDIETFVKDEYFLGRTCDNLYPRLMDDLKEFFGSGYYNEAIFTGCIEMDALVQGADGSLRTIREWIGNSGSVIGFTPTGGESAPTGFAKSSGILSVVRLELANGMVQRLTPDHRIMVWRDRYEWVSVRNAIVGEMVAVPGIIRVFPDSGLSPLEARLLANSCSGDMVPDVVCRASDEAVFSFIGRLWEKQDNPHSILRVPSERFARQIQLLSLRFRTRSRVGSDSEGWFVERTGITSRDIDLVPITNIEDAGEVEVGDICDVQDIHSFISNGIYSHNSIGWGKCLESLSFFVDGHSGRRMTVKDAAESSAVVPSLDGSSVVHRTASRIWKSGYKQCFRMMLASGQHLDASKDHPVLTPNGYTPLADLKVGDLVATARTVPAPENGPVVSDAEVKVAAYLLVDGGLTQGRCTYSKKNKKVFEDFEATVIQVPGFQGFGKDRTGNRTSIRGLKTWLRGLEIDRASKERRVPRDYFGLPDRQVALFLNRLFTGGSIYAQKPRKIEITLASEGLVDDIQYLLRRFGIVSRKRHRKKWIRREDSSKRWFDSWLLQISDAPTQLRFLEHVGPVFGEEDTCWRLLEDALKTKSNPNWDIVPITSVELKEIRRQTGPHTKKAWEATGGNLASGSHMGRSRFRRLCETIGYQGPYRKFADMDVVWEKVERLEDIGYRDVYDLTVPETANAVVNGIIVHNTFTASIAICRILYELSCMKNPHRTYGIAAGSNMSFVCLSVNETLAIKVAFENIATKIDASGYFMEHFPYERTKTELRFPGHIWVAARATTDTAALGLNTIGAMMDEGNFLPNNSNNDPRFAAVDRAEVIYNSLKRRLKSRFQDLGRLPGAIFIISSKQTSEDFTANRIKESVNDPAVFVRDYALWDVKPKELYSEERFHVLVGNEQTPSKILDPEEVEHFKAEKPEGCIVIDIPTDFYSDFDKDLEGCFTRDTKVSLLDGREVAIGDLVGEEEFWVYSYDAGGRLYPGRGHSARLTHGNAPIVEVELDNGEIIECTPNHLFMLRDGSYREAKDLVGESLMPLYRRKDGYEIKATAVRLTGSAPVYDITVDTYHNFSLSAGVVVHNSIRDIAGIATVSVSPYLQRREKIEDAIDTKRFHPFSAMVLDASKGGRFRWSDMVRPRLEKGDYGVKVERLRPIINPDAPRHVHIDPALKNDALGFCMSHVGGWKDVERRSADGARYSERAPIYVVDVVLQVVPPAGDEIILGDIRQLVYDLSEHGYTITKVTMDQFQCLAGDTLVNTSYGLLPIRDISVGDVVQSRTGPRRVLNTWSFGRRPTRRIVSQGISIEGTYEHRIEALVGGNDEFPIWGWRSLKDLRIGDVVRTTVGSVEAAIPQFGSSRVDAVFESENDVFDLEVDVDPSYVANCFVSHNSADSLQTLASKGYRAELLSVDRTPDAYDNLKTALYEGRVLYYEYPPLLKELRELELRFKNKRRKIDHPSHGSKDCADALAGVCFTLSDQQEAVPLPPMKGMSYYGEEDIWLPEQRQARMAGNSSAGMNKDLDDLSMLPPFLVGWGGGGGEGGGWGGWGDL